jgi:tRNA(Ile)-lysidine synthase
MKKICRKNNYDYAVTGHHADDYAESLMIHLIRGGGRSSLSSMNRFEKIDGLTIFRPFMAMNRERIDYYMNKYRIPYREDESNISELFLRNRIRKNILPLLKQEGLNPSHLWKNFHDGFDELWKAFEKNYVLDRILLDRNFFNESSPVIIKNILDTALKRLSLPPVTLGILHEITEQLFLKPFRLHLLTGKYILWSAESGPVWIFRKDSALLKKFHLIHKTDAKDFIIRYGGYEKTYSIPDHNFVTTRKDGMRMHIKGGSKKIKKILQELHIPSEIRDCIPLIANRDTGRVERICLSFIEGYKDRLSEIIQ